MRDLLLFLRCAIYNDFKVFLKPACENASVRLMQALGLFVHQIYNASAVYLLKAVMRVQLERWGEVK